MVVTLCTSGAVVLKAGVNANEILDTEYTQLINQAEGVIATVSRVDWVAVYSTLDINIKLILEEAASNLAGMYAIQRDMSGYTSRAEAQTMLDVLRDTVMRGFAILKEQDNKNWIQTND